MNKMGLINEIAAYLYSQKQAHLANLHHLKNRKVISHHRRDGLDPSLNTPYLMCNKTH